MKRRFTNKNQLVNAGMRIGGVASGTIGSGFLSDKLLPKVGLKNRTSKGLALVAAGSLMVAYAKTPYMEGVADGMIARGLIEAGRAMNIVEPISGVGTAEEFVGSYGADDYDDYYYTEDGEAVAGADDDSFIGS